MCGRLNAMRLRFVAVLTPLCARCRRPPPPLTPRPTQVMGPATIEDVIRALLGDPKPAGASSAARAAFAARRAVRERRQHVRLTSLAAIGRDPLDGAYLYKVKVSQTRHYIGEEDQHGPKRADIVVERVSGVAGEQLARREKAAVEAKARESPGPEGKARRLGSGKR